MSVASLNAQAVASGTIQFTGELIASTCDVSVEGAGSDATVVLPKISTASLTTLNDVAGKTQFTMSLTQCTVAGNVAAYFEPGTTVDINGRLKNTSGTATNVALQFRDVNDAVIKIGDVSQQSGHFFAQSAESGAGAADGSAELEYFVEYFAENTTTAGTVASSVVYSIQYQ
ncbi:MAG: type 1 fimbrial protein [Labilibaculum sp.]|nr:type 1 fimbrial protein [Labilibaculum sp.]